LILTGKVIWGEKQKKAEEKDRGDDKRGENAEGRRKNSPEASQ